MKKTDQSEWTPVNMNSPLEVNVDETTQVRVYGMVTDYGEGVKVRAEIWHRDLVPNRQKP